MSSRGLGSIKREGTTQIVADDFILSTAEDIVADPSAPDAFVDGIMEGKEWVWEGGILRERFCNDTRKRINTLVDKKRQIIISADKSPADLEGLEDRLKSRLGWGLVADIHPLTYELRLGILQAKAEQKSMKLTTEVLEFLADKITNNVREMEGALNRLAVHSSLQESEVTVDLVKDVLKDLLRTNSRKITIDEIQKKVVEHYNIQLSDMCTPRRSRSVARPRQVAMYLAKSITTRSLPEIGRKFGGRDHTTVIHAIKTIEEIMVNDPSLAEDIELLTRILQTS